MKSTLFKTALYMIALALFPATAHCLSPPKSNSIPPAFVLMRAKCRTCNNVRPVLALLRAYYRPCKHDASIGTPWRGRLACGRLLPKHARLRILSTAVFGTQATITILHNAADFLERVDPGGPPLEVLDISLPHGGAFPHSHVSHKSGRDVDLHFTYHADRQPTDIYPEAPLAWIDVPRTWLTIEGLLASRQVKIILIDYDVQKLLYEHVRATRSPWKRRLFQYPHGKSRRRGLIRHWPHHRCHMHVRFKCPPKQTACRG